MKWYINFCQNLWQDKLVIVLNDLPLNKYDFLFLCPFILELKFSSNTLGYLDYLEVKT